MAAPVGRVGSGLGGVGQYVLGDQMRVSARVCVRAVELANVREEASIFNQRFVSLRNCLKEIVGLEPAIENIELVTW